MYINFFYITLFVVNKTKVHFQLFIQICLSSSIVHEFKREKGLKLKEQKIILVSVLTLLAKRIKKEW